jgi:glycosyltransferase involved in cell wall biosynthesis
MQAKPMESNALADHSNERSYTVNMEWLASFEYEHGRKPRILGIGNLANNGFKNAIALRALGIECDVMCNDYYHVMASPEWECVDFTLAGLDMAAPDWRKCDLQDYKRPDWFAQGFYYTCIEYLIAKNENSKLAEHLRSCLENETHTGGRTIEVAEIPDQLDAFSAQLVAQRLSGLFDRLGLPGVLNANDLYRVYQSHFFTQRRLDRLFSHYDVVIGYATSGFFPLISSTVPYIAYEHGTIRELPFDGTLAGNICALVFKAANNVAITNCDNIVAAQRLQLSEFRFVPHAILEDWRHEGRNSELRQTLLDQGKYDLVVFSASRQHWTPAKIVSWEKGNDILIRGFAAFVKTKRPRARLVMVEWGETVAASKALIAQCDIEDNVLWVEPMSVRRIGAYVAASEVLADQFLIGAWGALMPIGMMHGVPTLIYVNEDVHRWCFREMPPVLNAQTEEDVCRLLEEVTIPERAREIGEASARWYDEFHSMKVVAERLLDAGRSAIEGHKARRGATMDMEPPIYWLGSKLRHVEAQVELATENILKLRRESEANETELLASLRFIEAQVGVAAGRILKLESESERNTTKLLALGWVLRLGARLRQILSFIRGRRET